MPLTIINRRKKIKSSFPKWILQSNSIKLESYYCFTSLAFLSNFWLFSLCFITTAWIFYDSLAIFSRRVVKRPEKLVTLKICNSWAVFSLIFKLPPWILWPWVSFLRPFWYAHFWSFSSQSMEQKKWLLKRTWKPLASRLAKVKKNPQNWIPRKRIRPRN